MVLFYPALDFGEMNVFRDFGPRNGHPTAKRKSGKSAVSTTIFSIKDFDFMFNGDANTYFNC